MYCPNCGTSQSQERPIQCESCELPLGPVHELLAANRDAIERKERIAREKRDRLIGAGLFVAIAAGPLAWGLKNGLGSAQTGDRSAGQPSLPAGGGARQLVADSTPTGSSSPARTS